MIGWLSWRRGWLVTAQTTYAGGNKRMGKGEVAGDRQMDGGRWRVSRDGGLWDYNGLMRADGIKLGKGL